MANIHMIPNGRLVEAPRTFQTKDKTTLCSIRVADNPPGGKESKFETMFVQFVLNEALTKVVLERGLDKGDIVSVGGQLVIRLYDRKAGGKGKKKAKAGEKGISYEIQYPSHFWIQQCAADSGAKSDEEEPDADETEDEETETETDDGALTDDPFAE